MVRWLAIYSDDDGNKLSAMISPQKATDFPFGVDVDVLGLNDFNPGGGLVLIEMPWGPNDTRPMVVDVGQDEEVTMQFIDI